VGLSELNAVRSYLRLMLVHLLKLHGWPDNPSSDHWRREIVAFQSDAAQRFAPSMRQRIDITALYARAVRELEGTAIDGRAPRPWPLDCPVRLDDLLTADRDRMVTLFTACRT
jgi:hypothetical protein